MWGCIAEYQRVILAVWWILLGLIALSGSAIVVGAALSIVYNFCCN